VLDRVRPEERLLTVAEGVSDSLSVQATDIDSLDHVLHLSKVMRRTGQGIDGVLCRLDLRPSKSFFFFLRPAESVLLDRSGGQVNN